MRKEKKIVGTLTHFISCTIACAWGSKQGKHRRDPSREHRKVIKIVSRGFDPFLLA